MRNTSPLIPYKGFLIEGAAMYGNPNSKEWRSLGTVYSASKSPVTEIRRIPGPLSTGKEEAIKVGLDLAKGWVDEHAREET